VFPSCLSPQPPDGHAPPPAFGGYLARLSPSELMDRVAACLPARIRGSDFLHRFTSHYDSVTLVEPNKEWVACRPGWQPCTDTAPRQRVPAPPRPHMHSSRSRVQCSTHGVVYDRCGLNMSPELCGWGPGGRLRRYAVLQPASHPVHEHFRVKAFRHGLALPPGPDQLELLGELMFQSHASYSGVGLGSAGTDRRVGACGSLQPEVHRQFAQPA
jgi:hypothetical protein